MQEWKKLGKLFEPDGTQWWMKTHASNPVAQVLQNGLLRVYFSGRATGNLAYISYADFDNNYKLVDICKKPILELGELGAFDDRGLSMGCVQTIGNRTYLYYLGWNLGHDVPFRNAIGLAIEQKDNQFERYSQGPLLDRTIVDPFSLSYPFILKEENVYKMWYGSHKKWGKTTNDMIHHIKYAESIDGIDWKPKGIVCIPTTNKDYAFSKPSVLKDGDLYKMWYSYRGGKYRIGYAESKNGLDWIRKDKQVGLAISENDWDSEMLCYPCVFDWNDKRYMLYNGNSYGQTGFGLAVLED